MAKESVVQIRLALFLKQSIDRPEELAVNINKDLGNIFQTPIIIPISLPKGVQFPVVQMQSASNDYRCEIFTDRVDFYIRALEKEEYTLLRDKLLNLMDSTLPNFISNIKRIGFVNNFFVADQNPNQTIAKLIDVKLKNALESEVSHQASLIYSFRETIDKFEINNYTSIHNVDLNNNAGVMIMRDFNTIPERNYSNKLNKENIKNLLNQMENKFHLEEIKSLLWE